MAASREVVLIGWADGIRYGILAGLHHGYSMGLRDALAVVVASNADELQPFAWTKTGEKVEENERLVVGDAKPGNALLTPMSGMYVEELLAVADKLDMCARVSMPEWPLPEGRGTSEDKLERELRAFERMPDDMLADYRGRFVAVHRGQIIDSDVNEIELAMRIEPRAMEEGAIAVCEVGEEGEEEVTTQEYPLVESPSWQ